MHETPDQPLSEMPAGQEGVIVALRGGRGFQQQAVAQGLTVGTRIKVVQRHSVDAEGRGIALRIGLTDLKIGHGMAEKILVGPRVRIRDLQVGQHARVTGYVTNDRDYRHKLLRMGMVKLAEFKLVRVAPLGDPVVIELRGSSLTLRKAEADAIAIDVIPQP